MEQHEYCCSCTAGCRSVQGLVPVPCFAPLEAHAAALQQQLHRSGGCGSGQGWDTLAAQTLRVNWQGEQGKCAVSPGCSDAGILWGRPRRRAPQRTPLVQPRSLRAAGCPAGLRYPPHLAGRLRQATGQGAQVTCTGDETSGMPRWAAAPRLRRQAAGRGSRAPGGPLGCPQRASHVVVVRSSRWCSRAGCTSLPTCLACCQVFCPGGRTTLLVLEPIA